MRRELVGEIVNCTCRMSSGRPPPVSLVQVSPPSAERDRPPPRAKKRAFLPWSFLPLPHAREHDVRMLRIDLHLRRSGAIICKQHALEGLPTIERAIQATLFVRPIWVAGDCHKDPVRVFRVNSYLSDLLA